MLASYLSGRREILPTHFRFFLICAWDIPAAKYKAGLIHLLAFDWWYYRQRKRNDRPLRNSPRNLMEWKKKETFLSLLSLLSGFFSSCFMSKKVYLITCYQHVWVGLIPRLWRLLFSLLHCTCYLFFFFFFMMTKGVPEAYYLFAGLPLFSNALLTQCYGDGVHEMRRGPNT